MDGDHPDETEHRRRDFVVVTPRIQLSIGGPVLAAGVAFVLVAGAIAILALTPFGIADDLDARGAMIVVLVLVLVAIAVGMWLSLRRRTSRLTTR